MIERMTKKVFAIVTALVLVSLRLYGATQGHSPLSDKVDLVVAEAKSAGVNHYYETIVTLRGEAGVTVFLQRYLSDPDPMLRMFIADTMSWEGTRSNIVALCETLGDTESFVRGSAVRSLSRFSTVVINNNRDVIEDPLLGYIQDGGEEGYKAVQVLMKTSPSERCLDQLNQISKKGFSGRSWSKTLAYVDVLLLIRGVPNAEGIINARLLGKDNFAIIDTMEAMASSEDPALVRILVPLLADKRPIRNVASSHMSAQFQRVCDLAAFAIINIAPEANHARSPAKYRIFNDVELARLRKRFE